MRAVSLTLEGFGPYLARQEIDFTAFDTDRLFVITGKTGAGKSTILDAITFALYGDVPRYDGTKATARSHFCGAEDPTSVTFVFEVGTERYRITRSPEYERPKQRGEGTTTETADAGLWRWAGRDWEAVAMKPREVGQEVGHILQLTADQFLQVILLAQGRFAEFLQAGTDARLKLLRSLFGTQRFETVTAHLRDIARERARAVEVADAEIDVLVRNAASLAHTEPPAVELRAEWFAGTDDALRATAAGLAQEEARATEAAEAARVALGEAREAEGRRAQLAGARDRVASLEELADAHEADRERLDRARRAAPVAGPVEAWRSWTERARAAAEKRDAVVVRARASEALPVALSGDPGDVEVAALKARATELATERGGLTAALAAERQVADLTRARESAVAAAEAAREARDQVQQELDAIPAEQDRLRKERDSVAGAAARLEDLEAAVEREQQAVTAHDRIDKAQTVLDDARKNEAVASAKRLGAIDRHHAMLTRRLESQAAHLAAKLTDGKPCAVCGSTTHPHPAQPTDLHVTDEQVEEARLFADQQTRAFEVLQTAAAEAVTGLEVAQSQAGGRTREQVAAALATATEQRDVAAAAAAKKAEIEARLEELDGRAGALRAALAERAAEVEGTQAAAVEAAAAVDAASAAVAGALAGFATVAARAQALEDAKALVEELVVAGEAQGETDRSEASAREALDRALAQAGLADANAAQEAVLPPDTMATLEESILQYQEELSGARAVVAELEHVELPAEPADLAALSAAAAQAVEAAKAAARSHAHADAAVGQFVTIATTYAEEAEANEVARVRALEAETLAATLEGKEPNERRMRLESFVLAARLEEIVDAANVRLTTMSSGQYTLEYDDGRQHRNVQTGLDLKVADAHTGRSRSTRSLSGGETFLASLALALGLAETVTAASGGIQLDTIFIDEGFGSLDADTLEIAMSTLDGLRDAGRTVGLISHVEAMKEAIPAKLEVTKAPDGSSRVRAVVGDAE